MTRRNFDTIMDHVFHWEGGYVDHPRDPGGATNMGITIHTLRALDMDLDMDGDIDKDDVKKVTRDVALSIYRLQYWDQVEGDRAPSGVDAVLMDGAVNSGPRASVRWVQRAMGITADGLLGPVTRRAISLSNPPVLVERAIDERLKSVRQFRNYDVFGQGWENRIYSLKDLAMGLAR